MEQKSFIGKKVDKKNLVEICLRKINDSFSLVILASHRAKELAAGVSPQISREGSKDAVLSLREIAGEAVRVEDLKERAIKSYQKFSFLEEDPAQKGR